MRAFAVAAGRKVAAAGAAGAGVTASQPSAQARELLPQQVPEHRSASSQPIRKPLDEDWLLTDLSEHEVLVFKPYSVEEVDAAVAQLAQQTFSGSVVVEDLSDGGSLVPSSTASPAGSRASTDTTYGADADHVIEEATHHHAGQLRAGPDAGQLVDLLAISRKLLSRPGLQREVFKCMLEDVEVRDLMLKQSRNLDLYLNAVGIHNPNLLPGPEGSSSRALPSLEYGEGVGEGQGKDLLQSIMDAMVACIDKTGSALAGLGGWLRDRVNELSASLNALFGGAQPSAAGDSGKDSKEGGEKPRRTGDVVMGAVMVVSVAVLCVLLARRPAFMARGLAGMAAAGAANMQSQRRRA